MNHGALEDSFARQDIESLIKRFQIKRVVETGSYYGCSTKIFASLVEVVDSIEIEKQYFNNQFVSYKMTLENGQSWSVPLDPANTDYQEIMKYIENGGIVIDNGGNS